MKESFGDASQLSTSAPSDALKEFFGDASQLSTSAPSDALKEAFGDASQEVLGDTSQERRHRCLEELSFKRRKST